MNKIFAMTSNFPQVILPIVVFVDLVLELLPLYQSLQQTVFAENLAKQISVKCGC